MCQKNDGKILCLKIFDFDGFMVILNGVKRALRGPKWPEVAVLVIET